LFTLVLIRCWYLFGYSAARAGETTIEDSGSRLSPSIEEGRIKKIEALLFIIRAACAIPIAVTLLHLQGVGLASDCK
jgi:hypothetical protein